jgi:hypothetical protein
MLSWAIKILDIVLEKLFDVSFDVLLTKFKSPIIIAPQKIKFLTDIYTSKFSISIKNKSSTPLFNIWILLDPHGLDSNSFYLKRRFSNHEKIASSPSEPLSAPFNFYYEVVGFDIGINSTPPRDVTLLKVHSLPADKTLLFDIIGTQKGSIHLSCLDYVKEPDPLLIQDDRVAVRLEFPEKVHRKLGTPFMLKKVRAFLSNMEDTEFEARIRSEHG